MRVILPSGEICWTRKQREGTANLASGSLGVMKNFSGRVREPAERAWMVRVGLVAISLSDFLIELDYYCAYLREVALYLLGVNSLLLEASLSRVGLRSGRRPHRLERTTTFAMFLTQLESAQ